MADNVKVQLAAHHQGHKPGDELELEPVEARRLIAAGVAVPATVPEAKRAGVDPDQAATKR